MSENADMAAELESIHRVAAKAMGVDRQDNETAGALVNELVERLAFAEGAAYDYWRDRCWEAEEKLAASDDECVRLTELMERAERLAAEEGAKRAEAEAKLAAAQALAEDLRAQIQAARKRAVKAEAEAKRWKSRRQATEQKLAYEEQLRGGYANEAEKWRLLADEHLDMVKHEAEMRELAERERNAAERERDELLDEVRRLKVEVRNAKLKSYNDLRKRAEKAEAELDEMSRAYRESDEHKAADELRGLLGECEDKLVKAEEKLAAKDAIIADLKRIVGKQEDELDALKMRVRELEVTP